MKNRSLTAFAVTVLLLVAQASVPVAAHAQVPGIINYQGRVTTGGTNFNGTGQFQFALLSGTNTAISATATAVVNSGFITSYVVVIPGSGYTSSPPVTISDSTGSGALAHANVSGGMVTSVVVSNGMVGINYSATPTITIAPPPPNIVATPAWSNGVNMVSLPVTKGLYSVLLGDTTIANMNSSIPATVFTNVDVLLRVWFNDGVNGLQQLSPDQRIAAAGYALNAASVPDGAITSAKIAAGAVGSSQIAAAAVGSSQIAAGAVGNSQLAASAVTGGDIASGQVVKSLNGLADAVTLSAGANITLTPSGNNIQIAATGSGNPSSDVFGKRLNIGTNNTLSGAYATIAGGSNNNAMGTLDAVGGGQNNIASNDYATVGGGINNTASGTRATVGGGQNNIASNQYATVGGGNGNTASGPGAFVGGGYSNIASNGQGTVGGGQQDIAGGENATVGGGYFNIASGFRATVGGGGGNLATNDYATVPGGVGNVAGGQYSFAAGQQAQATNDGAFVWADATGASFASTSNNQFNVRAAGGVRFFATSAANVGVQLAPGANAWSATSDRNVKENFKPVDVRGVLEKVAQMPVTEWNLITQDPSIRHIGPMAQDFKAAFGVGEDDKHISTTDEDGVALAAIQGLNQKLEQTAKEKDRQIAELRRELAELKATVQKVSEQVEQSKASSIPAANVGNHGGL